jgi:hypothetical protein
MPVLRPPTLMTAPPPPPPPDRYAVARAADDAARAAARAPGEAALHRASARTPTVLWVLLVAGFALLLGVLWVVLREGEETVDPGAGTVEEVGGSVPPPAPAPEPPPTPEEPTRLVEIDDFPGALPAYPAGGRAPSDGKPPIPIDGADPTWAAALGDGVTLLIFAGGPEESSAITRRTAHSLHRRFDGHGVRVALVLPRRVVENADGSLLKGAELTGALEQIDARDGITVVLDPNVSGKDALRVGRFGLRQDTGAVLLNHGQLEAQSSPPQGGMDVARLLPVGRKAWSLAGGAPGR